MLFLVYLCLFNVMMFVDAQSSANDTTTSASSVQATTTSSSSSTVAPTTTTIATTTTTAAATSSPSPTPSVGCLLNDNISVLLCVSSSIKTHYTDVVSKVNAAYDKFNITYRDCYDSQPTELASLSPVKQVF
jgi:hypothetical protein